MNLGFDSLCRATVSFRTRPSVSWRPTIGYRDVRCPQFRGEALKFLETVLSCPVLYQRRHTHPSIHPSVHPSSVVPPSIQQSSANSTRA